MIYERNKIHQTAVNPSATNLQLSEFILYIVLKWVFHLTLPSYRETVEHINDRRKTIPERYVFRYGKTTANP